MEQALTLNGPILDTNLAKLKETKSSVIKEMRSKVNSEELRIVLERLKEIGIPVTGEFNDIQELNSYLKKRLVKTDYEKAEEIITKVDKEFDRMITALENGSTNAFTRIMTGDLSTSIAKSLGISLTGNALLVLAPTLGTKALVGAGLGTYYLTKSLINRKEIKKVNTNNELNNIIFELEITKDGDKIIDTRFTEEVQKEVRDYFKRNKIYFEDTGYKSLKTAIYNLEYDKKLALAHFLNAKIGRGINIEERLEKVKKKLNVVASTIGSATAGLTLGTSVATTINNINPSLLAAPVNGTVLGKTLGSFFASLLDKPWLTKLTGLLGGVGTAVLSCISDLAKGIFSVENLLICGTLGLTGGIITSGMLNLISVIKQIKANKKNKKEIAEYNLLDNEKYQKENAAELEVIKEKITQKSNPEAILLDIVIGSLRDNNIVLKGSPNNLQELTKLINALPKDDKKVARRILENVDIALKSNKELVLQKLSQIATYISVFTLSGFSALSIYDIIKGGQILPELSKKLFPENNIHTPVAEAFTNDSHVITKKLTQEETDSYISKYFKSIENITEKESMTTSSGEKFDYQSYISSNIEKITKDMTPEELRKFYSALQSYEDRNPQYKQAAIDKLTKIIDARGNAIGEKMYTDLSSKEVTTDVYTAAQDNFTTEEQGFLRDYFQTTAKSAMDSQRGENVGLFGYDSINKETYIPTEEIRSYLQKCTPEEIMSLKHYIESNPNLTPEHVNSIKSRIDQIINNAEKLQDKYDVINKTARAVGTVGVPISTASAVRTSIKKRDNTKKHTK